MAADTTRSPPSPSLEKKLPKGPRAQGWRGDGRRERMRVCDDVVDGIPRARAWKDKSKHACDGPARKREPYTCERRIAWQGSDVEVGKRPVTVPGSLLS